MVLAEVAILLSGIIARAVFHHPIIWSDELASILFLWLAMLVFAPRGATRHPHAPDVLRVLLMGPRAQRWAETLAVGTTLAFFLGLALHPAYEYLQDQAFVEIRCARLVGHRQGTGHSVRLRGRICQLPACASFITTSATSRASWRSWR